MTPSSSSPFAVDNLCGQIHSLRRVEPPADDEDRIVD
jgi:hypothetical protein